MTFNGQSAPGFSLGASGWIISPTSGAQRLQTGYSPLQCSSPVEAAVLYSLYSPSGLKLSEATVFSSPSGSLLQILADQREGARIGIAVANDSDQQDSITVSAYNSAGLLVESPKLLSIPARTSQAAFLDGWISVPAGYYGRVTASSSNGSASIIGFRYTGNVFTTIPQTWRK
jgi:hypothetical protein